MDAEKRLAKLEKEYRWMRAVLGVFVVISVAFAFIGGEQEEDKTEVLKEVRAEKYTLVNSKNEVRGCLATADRGTNLLLMHEGTRLWLNTSKYVGSWVDMLNDKGGSIQLALSPMGTCKLRFCDKSGQGRFDVLTTDDGIPSLALRDKNGTSHVELCFMRKLDGQIVLREGDGSLTLLPAR